MKSPIQLRQDGNAKLFRLSKLTAGSFTTDKVICFLSNRTACSSPGLIILLLIPSRVKCSGFSVAIFEEIVLDKMYDLEIAHKHNLSRQYINRLRRDIYNILRKEYFV